MSNQNTAILVLSCDKYADAWLPFFSFFQKYWKDCPYPVYLGTNSEEFIFPGVKQVFSNRKTTWSDEIDVILRQIPEKYVLIILEDYFIYEPVDNLKIERIIRSMEKHDAAYTKLGAFPAKYNSLWPSDPLQDNPELGAIRKGSEYRLCLQTALWNKEMLLGLLNPDEDPWQFEIEASKRSNSLENPFFSVIPDPKERRVHGPIVYYCTALTAGKWMRGALKLAKKEGIVIDTSNRPVEGLLEKMKRDIYISLPLPLRKMANFTGQFVKR